MPLLRADDQNSSSYRVIPTMAYYSKGRVIYYGYTPYTGYRDGGHAYDSSILASNAAYVRAHYQNPTMAYYSKDRVTYYAYTSYLPNRPAEFPDWRDLEQSSRQFAGSSAPELNSLVRTSSVETAPESAPVKMRASPVSNREAFEQEAEQTQGTLEENRVALQSSPVDAAGFYKRANAYKDTRDYARAIADYNEVIRLEPDNPYAYFKLGLCYSAINRMDVAGENFRKANELMSNPEKPWSRKSRSWYPQSGY